MRWKILSLTLLATLVGVIWGTFVYPELPFATVQAQSISPAGKARIGVAPRIISYQGYLKDSSSGQPVSNANRTAVFSLYTSDSGGSTVWQETKTIVTRNGVFHTILGQTYPINPSIVAVPELWLGVRLPPDAEMTPRQRITGSVYSVGAMEAQVADTVSVSPAQIAHRKWYDLNLGRPERLDVAYSQLYRNSCLDSGDKGCARKLDSVESPVIDIYADVNSLGVTSGGHVIVNAGNALLSNPAIQESVQGDNSIWVPKCYSLTTLGLKVVCASGTHLMIMANFEILYETNFDLKTQDIACDDCRYTSYDGKNLWATDYDDGKVRRIDLTPTWSPASTSTMNAASGRLMVVEDAFRYPFPDAPTITASYDVGANPMGIEHDGERIWVANNGEDTVTVLSASDGSFVTTIAVGDQPTEVLFDGASIWVLNTGDDTITKINASNQIVSGTFSTGANPADISFDGSRIWIANTLSETITLLRASDGTETNTLTLLGAPYHLLFDGVRTWVATKENQPSVIATYGNRPHTESFTITGERWFITGY